MKRYHRVIIPSAAEEDTLALTDDDGDDIMDNDMPMEPKTKKRRLHDMMKGTSAVVMSGNSTTTATCASIIASTKPDVGMNSASDGKGSLTTDIISKELNCAICGNMMIDASVLPCAHVFW